MKQGDTSLLLGSHHIMRGTGTHTPAVAQRHAALSHDSRALKEARLVSFSQCYFKQITVIFPLEFIIFSLLEQYFVFKLMDHHLDLFSMLVTEKPFL